MSAGSGPIRFSKMHGAGNDFVILDLRGGRQPPAREEVALLCDRHRGVGCDQLLTIEDPRRDDCLARYRIFNADGSEALQCGNGARCLAAWLCREGTAGDAGFQLESPSGPVPVQRRRDGRLQVALSTPDFEPPAIPLAIDAAASHYRTKLDGQEIEFGAVSIGNPHAVIEVASVAEAEVASIGAALQRHPLFPQRANVGFAEVVDRHHIRLRVYERGVGETLACGSGACAAAAVLIARDRIAPPVAVELPGGTLEVDWPAPGAPVSLTGPATFVFEGQWNPT